MEEKKNRPCQPQNGKVLLDPEPVASSTECTGLLSFMPRTADECAQYGEIYDIPLPVETVSENPVLTTGKMDKEDAAQTKGLFQSN